MAQIADTEADKTAAVPAKIATIPHSGFDQLVICVLTACEAAREQIGERDVLQERRQSDRHALADLPIALRALGRLRRFVRRYPNQVDWPATHLFLRLREEGFQFGTNDARILPAAEILQRMLEILDEALRSSLLAQQGVLQHRYQEGGLFFEQPRDQQDHGLSNPVLTTLMFQLVYMLRRFTAGVTTRGQSLHGGSPRMPSEGQPRYRLAIAFVDATLDRHTEDVKTLERTFKKFLRAHPEAEWGPWPGELSSKKKG